MSITLGSTAPSQITLNLDDVFAQSLANYQKEMIDNIGKELPFLFMLLASGQYQGTDGGTDLRGPLMYAMNTMDSYDGYDEMGVLPTEGVTQWVDEWRQCATPIVYSMKEVIQNARQIVDFVETRIKQAEMGIHEGWSDAFFTGAGATSAALLRTPKTSPINGSSYFNPIGKLIDYVPTNSSTVHNINQFTYSWWRNLIKASSATTGDGLLSECLTFYNTLGLKTGGKPELMICDQTTHELLTQAYFQRFRATQTDNNFPFENIRLRNARIVMESAVNDVYTPAAGTDTKGTIYYMNMKYFRVKYINGRNFEMLKDENGKTFVKPNNGDSRLGHLAWMGQVICNQRRKQGVHGNIARTLTFSV